MPKTMAERFRVGPGKRVDLSRRDPADASAFPDRDKAEEQSKADAKVINEWQDKLYAEGKRALLVILQGTDTSGKDGTIRHVFNETGPLGVTVTSFRRPSEEELAHDFLWRVHLACPRRGSIGIFNRSHYEDVLVVRVHDLAPKALWKERYDHIADFEELLGEHGCIVLKYFLHIDRKEQKQAQSQSPRDPKDPERAREDKKPKDETEAARLRRIEAWIARLPPEEQERLSRDDLSGVPARYRRLIREYTALRAKREAEQEADAR